MTTPTSSPVPSTAPQDLLFNAGKLDEVINGPDAFFVDRFGKRRRTVAGSLASLDASAASAETAAEAILVQQHSAAAAIAEAVGNLSTEELNGLAGGTGATMVGSGARSVQNRLDDEINILDKGALGDDSTFNDSALAALYTEVGDGGRIHFPNVPGAANVYRFQNGFGPYMEGRVFDVDDGVKLSGPDSSYVAPTTVKVVRPFQCIDRTAGTSIWMGAKRNRPLAAKSYVMPVGDVDVSTLRSIDCVNDLKDVVIAFPGDTITDGTSTKTAATVEWLNKPAGSIYASLSIVQPGDEIEAFFSSVTGTHSLAAVVRGPGGWSAIMTGTADYSGASRSTKIIGSALEQVDMPYDGSGVHASYSGVRSVWKIRLISWSVYAVLFNGMEVARGTLTGPILEAGFGVYAIGSDSDVIAKGWVRRRNRSAHGLSRAIRVAAIGDSITAPRFDAWPNHMREALEGALGLRVVSLKNIAWPGDTIAAQWTKLQAQGLDGAHVAFIQIGTNDIQGLTSESSFAANLENIRAYCVSNGCIPVFGVPPMFYIKSLSGGVGTDFVNYEAGNYIRSLVARFCGDNSLRCVDVGEVLGPVLANFVNSALTPYWGGDQWNDSMVFDNGHPGAVMGQLLGQAYAKAGAGALLLNGSNVAPFKRQLTPFTLPASFARNGWTLQASLEIDEGGCIAFGGVAVVNSAAIADGTVIANIPRGWWPRSGKHLSCATNIAGKPCDILVNEGNGDVSVFGLPAGAGFVYLDNLTWMVLGAA